MFLMAYLMIWQTKKSVDMFAGNHKYKETFNINSLQSSHSISFFIGNPVDM